MRTLNKDWQSEQQERFLKLKWDTDLIPLLRTCYELASKDVELTNPYTSVVLDNIKIITNKNPMSMSFKQYKSFIMYSKENEPKEIILEKLYTNEQESNR